MNPDEVRRLLRTRITPPRPLPPEPTLSDSLRRLFRRGRSVNAARIRRHAPNREDDAPETFVRADRVA